VLIGSSRLAPGTSTDHVIGRRAALGVHLLRGVAVIVPSSRRRAAETGRQQAPSPVGVGGGPDEAVAGVGPRVPAGLRGGANGGPALPVRRLHQLAAHVRLPRHLVRRRGHRAPLRRGRRARLEPRAAGPGRFPRSGAEAGGARGGRGGGCISSEADGPQQRRGA
jgi:hypothetical protein